MTQETTIAVLSGLGAALAFGTAGALQHRATQVAPRRRPLRPRLLWDLSQVRAFRASVGLGALGFALQVLALRYAPLILVQPLLVTGVLFYIAVAHTLDRRRPDGPLVGGALLAMAGLTGFLLVAKPSPGAAVLDPSDAISLGVLLVVAVAVCLVATSLLRREEFRALPLAVATAVCYGVTAGLVRSLESASLLGEEPLIAQWQLYAVAVVGPVGFLLNQNAFQNGVIGAVAVTTITVGDPVVAIAIGAAWLGESIAGGPWATAGEVVTLLTMAAGVLLLAHRSQYVADQLRPGGQARAEGC